MRQQYEYRLSQAEQEIVTRVIENLQHPMTGYKSKEVFNCGRNTYLETTNVNRATTLIAASLRRIDVPDDNKKQECIVHFKDDLVSNISRALLRNDPDTRKKSSFIGKETGIAEIEAVKWLQNEAFISGELGIVNRYKNMRAKGQEPTQEEQARQAQQRHSAATRNSNLSGVYSDEGRESSASSVSSDDSEDKKPSAKTQTPTEGLSGRVKGMPLQEENTLNQSCSENEEFMRLAQARSVADAFKKRQTHAEKLKGSKEGNYLGR